MTEADEHVDEQARAAREPSESRRLLRAVQAVLIVVLALLALVRREAQYWPIVTWPVYAMSRPVAPGPTMERLELRVATADGERLVWEAEELVERSRSRMARMAFRLAVDADDAEERRAWREWLQALLVRKGLHEVATVSVWNVGWDVDSTQVPPLDRDAPAYEELRAEWKPRDERPAS